MPNPTATSLRIALPPTANVLNDSRKSDSTFCGILLRLRRGSCFHKAGTFNSRVITAAACITRIKRPGLKSANAAPNNKALTIIPNSSITYIKPTTLGRDSGGAKSVASASPTVCVVCKPAPTKRNATAAPNCPIHTGASFALPRPDNTNKANGMIAKPPNCTKVPIQM